MKALSGFVGAVNLIVGTGHVLEGDLVIGAINVVLGVAMLWLWGKKP